VNSGHTVFQGKHNLLKNPVNDKKCIQYNEKFQAKVCLFRASASCSKILKYKKYFNAVKISGQTLFSG